MLFHQFSLCQSMFFFPHFLFLLFYLVRSQSRECSYLLAVYWSMLAKVKLFHWVYYIFILASYSFIFYVLFCLILHRHMRIAHSIPHTYTHTHTCIRLNYYDFHRVRAILILIQRISTIYFRIKLPLVRIYKLCTWKLNVCFLFIWINTIKW